MAEQARGLRFIKGSLPDRITGIIFDCDGVLIDSKRANMTYYNRLLAAVGRPPMTEKQETFVHMASEQQAVRYIMGEGHEDLYRAAAVSVPYKDVVLPLLELDEGVAETLAWLCEAGFKLAVHTNRGSGMWDLVDKFGLHGMFDPIMTAHDVNPKPSSEGVRRILDAWDVPPETVIFVGDSRADAGAAAGERVPFVAFRNPRLAACAHVAHFHELRELVSPRRMHVSQIPKF